MIKHLYKTFFPQKMKIAFVFQLKALAQLIFLSKYHRKLIFLYQSIKEKASCKITLAAFRLKSLATDHFHLKKIFPL